MSPILKAKLIVLTLFLLVSAGMTAYTVYYVWPANKCEQAGHWWAARWRVCATPINVADFTGRPNPTNPNHGPVPAPVKAP